MSFTCTRGTETTHSIRSNVPTLSRRNYLNLSIDVRLYRLKSVNARLIDFCHLSFLTAFVSTSPITLIENYNLFFIPRKFLIHSLSNKRLELSKAKLIYLANTRR